MTAATRKAFIELGHKSGNDIVPRSDLLDTAFEQYGPVGSFQYVGVFDCGFVHSGSCFSMNSLYWYVELCEQIKQIVEEGTILRSTQNGVSEHAVRQRAKVAEMLIVKFLAGILEIEPFKL